MSPRPASRLTRGAGLGRLRRAQRARRELLTARLLGLSTALAHSALGTRVPGVRGRRLTPAWAGAGGVSWQRLVSSATETPDRRRRLPSVVEGSLTVNGRGNVADLDLDLEEEEEEEEEEDTELAADRDQDRETVRTLLAEAQQGQAEAFGQLYDRYVTLIYRYTYYRVGSVALAEDLTSETFLRALRRISSFTWQGRDFGAWLITIARNLVADHYKSARFRLELPTANMLQADAEELAAGPEGQVIGGLTNAALLDAVRELGSEQQECIVLRFFEGLSLTETALAMDKSAGAVKALQYRAVRSLARLLPADFHR